MLTPLQITSQALNIQCNVKLDSISFSKGVFLQKIKSVFNSNKNLSSATSPQPTDINKIRNKVILALHMNIPLFFQKNTQVKFSRKLLCYQIPLTMRTSPQLY